MLEGGISKDFHERFDIDVGIEEARQRFINRIEITIFDPVPNEVLKSGALQVGELNRRVAYYVGVTLEEMLTLRTYVVNDFPRCLNVLEGMYEVIPSLGIRETLDERIEVALRVSETELGVRWASPTFVRTGAKLLDDSLVNEPLRWLRVQKYKSVLDPFEKGLSHYLEAAQKPERLSDVVTDMYEALEALARVITGKDSELSGNRELFIKRLNLSSHYKELLRNYIGYGNEYRHAVRRNQIRPSLSESEVEAFIYLTGLFIRLAMRQNLLLTP